MGFYVGSFGSGFADVFLIASFLIGALTVVAKKEQ